MKWIYKGIYALSLSIFPEKAKYIYISSSILSSHFP